MKIQILVKTNARKSGVEKRADGSYRISVKSPPVEGRANEEVIELLADYFSVPKSAVRIVRGLKGRKKWIFVPGR